MSTGSDSREMERAAVEAFRSLSEIWGFSRDEASRLVQVSEDVIARWFEGLDDARLDSSQLERISYLVGIYEALHTFFGDALSADGWPRRPNAHFGGRSAIDRMLDGIDGITEVHRYTYQMAYIGW